MSAGRLEAPRHLNLLVSLFRRAFLATAGLGPPVRACISAPPQVGKTLTGQHALASWLERRPQDFLAYVTYGQDIASLKSRTVRDLVRECGVQLRTDSQAVDLWQTTQNGGLLARGRDAGITGHSGVKLVWYDDMYRNRAEAESRVIRSKVDDDFASTIVTRAHPTTSIIVSHTRWNEDDQTGRLKKRSERTGGWEFYNIPAIEYVEKGGEVVAVPLWPESGRTLEFWAQQRRDAKSDYNWYSLFQGEPRPREGKVFKGTTLYSGQPHIHRVAIGLDLAYTAGTQSDWSVAVVLGLGTDERVYVLNVVREQVAAPAFAQTVKRLQSRYPGAPTRWYAYGPEKGSADFIRDEGVRLDALSAPGDKYQRALGVSARWNEGGVLVPLEPPPWLADFTEEVLDFTGLSDAFDDQVDALGAAFDALTEHGGAVATEVPKDVLARPGRSSLWGASRGGNPWGRH